MHRGSGRAAPDNPHIGPFDGFEAVYLKAEELGGGLPPAP